MTIKESLLLFIYILFHKMNYFEIISIFFQKISKLDSITNVNYLVFVKMIFKKSKECVKRKIQRDLKIFKSL